MDKRAGPSWLFILLLHCVDHLLGLYHYRTWEIGSASVCVCVCVSLCVWYSWCICLLFRSGVCWTPPLLAPPLLCKLEIDAVSWLPSLTWDLLVCQLWRFLEVRALCLTLSKLSIWLDDSTKCSRGKKKKLPLVVLRLPFKQGHWLHKEDAGGKITGDISYWLIV